MKHYTSNHKQTIRTNIIVTIILILIWEFVASIFPVPFLLAGPIEVARRFFELIFTQGFWRSVASSSLRILLGLILGIVIGVLTAIIAKSNVWLSAIFKQLSLLSKTVPIAVVSILLLILFSNQWIATTVVFIMSFPIIFTNYLKGLEKYDDNILELAQVFQWSNIKKWKYVYLKSAEPYLQSGLEIACGMAWKAGIAAEILGVPEHSFGEKIYSAKVFLESADIFAYAIAIVLLSLLFEKIISFIILRIHRRLRGLA